VQTIRVEGLAVQRMQGYNEDACQTNTDKDTRGANTTHTETCTEERGGVEERERGGRERVVGFG